MRTPSASPTSAVAAAHSAAVFSASRPITDTIAEGVASAAACIDSPRSLTSLSPSSKESAPAKVSAVYSPRERPQATSTASMSAWPFSPERIFSTAASDET